MSEFRPVETVEDLNSLDSDEVFEGYRAGLQCAPVSRYPPSLRRVFS